MATARQILQQEIFDQCDQKLLAFVGVSNDSKKKEIWILVSIRHQGTTFKYIYSSDKI